MLYPCKFGSVQSHVITGSAIATASGSTSAKTIPNVKKGDIIVMNVIEAYGTSVTLTNATQIGSQDTWQAGTGSTWGFWLVAQATADGDVIVNRTGNGSFQSVKYTIATLS